MSSATQAEDGAGAEKSIGLATVLLIALSYGLVHGGARLFASGNLGEPEPVNNLLIQTLEAGYRPDRLPLYDWLLWALQQGLGAGVHAFLVLKYGLLVAMAGFLFLAAWRVTGSRLWALVAVDSMALIYQIFWRFHESYTDLIAVMTLALAAYWALLRVLETRRWPDYMLFALFSGLGMLSAQSFLLFLPALLAAALLQPASRRVVLAPGMLMVFPVVALFVSPFASWLMADQARLAGFVSSLLPLTPDFSVAGLAKSMLNAVLNPVLSLAPYVFLLPLAFPGLLKTLPRQAIYPRRLAFADAPDLALLTFHVILIEIGALLAFALIFSPGNYPVQNLLPLFLIAVVWLTDGVRRSIPSSRQIRRFFWLTAAMALLALVVRLANMYVHEPVCSKCRWGVPYAELAGKMQEQGFVRGTIVATDTDTGGNLRRFFPDSRVVLAEQYTADGAGQVAFVGLNEAAVANLAMQGATRPADVERCAIPWTHYWKPTGYRYSTWWLAVHPSAQSHAR